jgi:CheY-like chemotaxis protein
MVARGEFDAIVLDVLMPNLDGFEVFAACERQGVERRA